MTTIDNKFRSKVFKAAWTSIRNGRSSDMSIALKSAWSWAKRTLIESTVNLSGKISRQTEKAVAVSVRFVCVHTDQVVNRLMWIPKSLMNGNEVASKFIDRKIDEMKSEFSSYGGYNSIIVEF